MKSDPVLLKWYRIINSKFFLGELPNSVCVRWVNDEDKEEEKRCEDKYFGWAEEGETSRHKYEIVLSRKKNTSLSAKLCTLAHECCHIATQLKDDHGPAFEAQRQKIADRGIFKKGALAKNITLF